ncbi:hypothetical protein F4809DRAFT_124559 [Biscogniauxia mediterranea]|nr:hypothetical protein F4809DRAFT_124559 [Biscogniauxia mediterranea]
MSIRTSLLSRSSSDTAFPPLSSADQVVFQRLRYPYLCYITCLFHHLIPGCLLCHTSPPGHSSELSCLFLFIASHFNPLPTCPLPFHPSTYLSGCSATHAFLSIYLCFLPAHVRTSAHYTYIRIYLCGICIVSYLYHHHRYARTCSQKSSPPSLPPIYPSAYLVLPYMTITLSAYLLHSHI